MNEKVLAALIAAVVSLLVSLLTHCFNRKKLQSEEKRHALDHQRRLTEKLLDLRLVAYRKAFSITYKLTSPFLLRDSETDPEYVESVKTELVEWERADGAFLFTKASLRAYRSLLSALSVKPLGDGKYSRNQRNQMWRCKNRFRGTLKSDLKLLYEEDSVGKSDEEYQEL